VKKGYVYIMANKSNSVLYTGVTSDLLKRVYELKKLIGSEFTSKYKCIKLVFFQEVGNMYNAIEFEKKIKAGSRKNKEKLISKMNPNWIDLAEDWY
jgi:putative endonuclease